MNCATSNATTITAEPAVSFVPARPPPPGRFRTELLSVATLVLWLGCAVVGGLGLTLSYARPMPGLAEAAPVQAEILEVQLADATFSAPEFDPSPADTVLAQPPALEPMPSPSTVSMLAVAEPTPLVAFPLPVEGPVRLVAPDLAAYAPMRSRADLDAGPAPVLQVINHGHGEGRQPAPEYPRLALREGQEGDCDGPVQRGRKRACARGGAGQGTPMAVAERCGLARGQGTLAVSARAGAALRSGHSI
jgi:hypothetical protein